MNETILLDPTSEQSPARRERRTPPAALDGLTVALLDIGKARGDVFLQQLGLRLGERGIAVRHYAKPTNTKVAPVALAQQIAEECDLVVEALSD
ncbi:MAG: hypothetical protein H6983_02560 [Ectothiorhodospiraceae bacterium]|nr:hypothetical protein [Ectothiorhodospiraceae bacterium]